MSDEAALDALARRYVWWQSPTQALAHLDHLLCQLMQLGTLEAKDYLDIAALIERGVALERILGAAATLFGSSFSPLVAQKAISYFEGGDLDTLEEPVRQMLVEHAARDLEIAVVPLASVRLD